MDGRVSRGRDNVAKVMLLIATLGALSSFVFSIGAAMSADADIRVVELWRSYGYVVFAGLFVLLAWRHRNHPGVWELVILHKLALTVSSVTVMSGAAGATTVLVADGIVSILLIASYWLSRGYAGWANLSRSS